ncbi:MAG TPA: hypothetical protein DDZ80_18840 [Cyanobacteria bacterium UBA8803]|nr:hypothetical protein [Cyanobacteria bacterium UBA9273]HBL60434.1 hypothetical protein [Cyanobacteria bacterium UBA8803]
MAVLTDVWLDEWDAQIWSRDREGDVLLSRWEGDSWLDEWDVDALLGDWQKFQENLEEFVATSQAWE